jgi:MFS family permease
MRPRSMIAVLAGVVLIGLACAAWQQSVPRPGDRPLSPVLVAGWRVAAIGVGLAAQAVIIGAVLPAIYRPRLAYRRAGAAAMLLGTSGIVVAVALIGLAG